MKVIGKFLAVIYTTFFTIILTAFISLFLVQGIVSKDFIVSTLKNLNFSEVTVKEFGLDEYMAKYGETATVEDAIIAELKNHGFDETKAREIINDEHIREFIAGKISEALDALANNTQVKNVTVPEIKEALQNLELSETDFSEVTDFINEVIDDLNKEVQNGESV